MRAHSMSSPIFPGGSQWAPLIAPKNVTDNARRAHAEWHNCPTLLAVRIFWPNEISPGLMTRAWKTAADYFEIGHRIAGSDVEHEAADERPCSRASVIRR